MDWPFWILVGVILFQFYELRQWIKFINEYESICSNFLKQIHELESIIDKYEDLYESSINFEYELNSYDSKEKEVANGNINKTE